VAARWGKLRWIGLGLAVVFALGLTGDRLHESWVARNKPPVRSYGTVQPWVTTPDFSPPWSQALGALVTFLHQQAPAGRTVFIYNQAPQIYLLADRHNPTDQDLVMGVYNTPHQLCRVLTALKLHPPVLVVYDHLDQVDFTQDLRFADARHVDYRLRAIEAWLAKDYHLSAQAGPLVVWMRVPKAKPSHP
jgi:hypothetical protein